jgi:hypothetical protein
MSSLPTSFPRATVLVSRRAPTRRTASEVEKAMAKSPEPFEKLDPVRATPPSSNARRCVDSRREADSGLEDSDGVRVAVEHQWVLRLIPVG